MKNPGQQRITTRGVCGTIKTGAASGAGLEEMDDGQKTDGGRADGVTADATRADGQPTTPVLDLASRLVVGGKHRATVRYVGPVDGQEGYWVGLEWDDTDRGKHDGSHNGRRYFVSRVPGAASFVRYTSLLKHGISHGVSLKDAVRAKYKDIEPSLRRPEPAGKPKAGGSFAPRPAARSNNSSGLGAGEHAVVQGDVERISELLSEDGALEVAGLASLSISTACDRLEFLKNVKELDLSDNLLSERSWSEVLELTTSLTSLRVLNLSNNRMGDVPAHGDGYCRHYRNTVVTTLALNGCMILDVKTLRWVGLAFPNLKELYMYNNRIRLESAAGAPEASSPPVTTATHPLAFASLEVMDLGQNGIVSWAALECLVGGLSCLRVLSLQGNGIDELPMPGGGRFLALEHLNIARNKVENWDRGIQNLQYLNRLVELRFSDNPVCSRSPDLDRLVALGRLGSLTWINGSDVGAAERRDSEIAFLRNLERYVSTVAGPLEERIVALERAYGVPRNAALLGAVRGGGPSLDLVELILMRGGEGVTSKRIPSALTLTKLEKVTNKLLARLSRRDDSGGDGGGGDEDNHADRGLVVVLGGARFDAGELFNGVEGRLTVGEVLASVAGE